MVVLDTTMLMLFFRPSVAGRKFDFAGKEIDHVKERVEFLVKELDKLKTQIIIPTPALSEILVRVGAAESQKILEKIDRAYVFRIEPFDTKAAIEVAAMTRAALEEGDKKGGSRDVWRKVKFDHQIVAIARVHRATTIYSDDKNIRTIVKAVNIQTIGLTALLLPPRTAQGELKLVLSPLMIQGKMLMFQSQKGPMVPKSADDKNQSKLFIGKARELGCDENPAHFDEILKKVARHKPPPDALIEPKKPKRKKPGL